MGKYESLKPIAEKLKALDNYEKLKILVLLVDEGAKSVTDIAKEMKINFSTAHKYLEQLEKVGLVTSKQVAENRLKRKFYVGDFDIHLSPRDLSTIKSEKVSKSEKEIILVSGEGEACKFDENLFTKKYYECGVPGHIIEDGLKSAKHNLYDYATTYELRTKFMRIIKDRLRESYRAISKLDQTELKRRTYMGVLSLLQPEFISKFVNGEVFIHNIKTPKLLSFAPDLRGLSVHGATGEDPATLDILFNQIVFALQSKSAFTLPQYSFDSFNYIVAPYTLKISEDAIKKQITHFFKQLDEKDYKIYVSIDIGQAKYANELAPMYYKDMRKTAEIYAQLQDEAERINKIITALFEKTTFKNIRLIYKVWGHKFNIPNFGFYIANMNPAWQTDAANYVGPHSRFDMSWKGWTATNRVGELQSISINLYKIATESASVAEFSDKAYKLIEECITAITNTTELSIGEISQRSTVLPSIRKNKWDYILPSDCSFSISLAGLAKAYTMLCKSMSEQTIKLIEEFLRKCNEIINNKNLSIRVLLKEEYSNTILNRFKAISKISLKEDVDPFIAVRMHKYLKGGHCVKIERKEINKFLKSDGGLALIFKLD